MRVMSGRNAGNYFFSNHPPVCSRAETERRRESAKQERCQELSVCMYEKNRSEVLHSTHTVRDRLSKSFYGLVGNGNMKCWRTFKLAELLLQNTADAVQVKTNVNNWDPVPA